ncbi:unnamed protein product, partial [Medioppia subpectinata]
VHRLEELESELNVIINETQHKRKWSPEDSTFRDIPRLGSDVNTHKDHMTVATTDWPPIERQTHDMNEDINGSDNDIKPVLTPESDGISLSATQELAVTDSHNKTSLAIQSTTSHKPSVDNSKALRVKRVTVGTALVSQPMTTTVGNKSTVKAMPKTTDAYECEASLRAHNQSVGHSTTSTEEIRQRIDETIVSNSAIINTLAVNSKYTPNQYTKRQPKSIIPLTQRIDITLNEEMISRNELAVTDSHNKTSLAIQSTTAYKPSVDYNKALQVKRVTVGTANHYPNSVGRNPLAVNTKKYPKLYPKLQPKSTISLTVPTTVSANPQPNTDKNQILVVLPINRVTTGSALRPQTTTGVGKVVDTKSPVYVLPKTTQALNAIKISDKTVFLSQIIDSVNNNQRLNTTGSVQSVVKSYDFQYKCPTGCGYGADDKPSLVEHMKNKHKDIQTFECNSNTCREMYTTLPELKRHITEKHLIRRYVCDRGFKTGSILRQHLDGVHSTREYRCDWPDCQHRTHTKALLRAHRLTHSADKPFKCQWPGCDYRCKTLSLMCSHRRIHANRQFACDWPQCDRRFKTKSSLKLHSVVHKGLVPPAPQSADKSYLCAHEDCGQRFATKLQFDSHVRAAHPTDLPFGCDYENCDKRYKKRNELYRHKKLTHLTVGRQFRCPESGCGRDFRTDKEMKRHLNDVHSTREYRCDWPDCQHRTHTQKQMNNHRRVHSNHKPYACDSPGCEYRGHSHGLLRSHKMNCHTEPSLACDWPACDYKGRTKFQIQLHRMSHTGDKPYECEWPGCDYKCSTTSNIQAHRMTHTGDKPYACVWPDCDQRFAKKSTLKIHVRTHSAPDIECDVDGCKFRTRYKKTIASHKRLIHKLFV